MEKAECVLFFHDMKSAICIQSEFRRRYGSNPPDANATKRHPYINLPHGNVLLQATLIISKRGRSIRNPCHFQDHLARAENDALLRARKTGKYPDFLEIRGGYASPIRFHFHPGAQVVAVTTHAEKDRRVGIVKGLRPPHFSFFSYPWMDIWLTSSPSAERQVP
ncbi:hypothetical protein CDAR_247191 [Caerostris darwini]|uniref:DUF4817 domain-containing protein n=1 Tax=Caerostris darwini TaxID=1538125 RepID=A0AAV4TVE2_9ARAC|nr:hypothetical protein CDAR_247191 [Caerostris darwini]